MFLSDTLFKHQLALSDCRVENLAQSSVNEVSIVVSGCLLLLLWRYLLQLQLHQLLEVLLRKNHVLVGLKSVLETEFKY